MSRGPHATGRLPWAIAQGEDAVGPWADLAILGEGGKGKSAVVQRMRWIPPGEFWMGSGEEDKEAHGDEKPQHPVRLTGGFWLGDTPVTQAFYYAVMGENPSTFADKADGSDRPVEMVDLHTAALFPARLEAQILQRLGCAADGNEGLGFRLPTEAEWEYACRSGMPVPRYGPLDAVAWYDENSGGETHPVARKAPSPWGLYDMLGNVWEWCLDAGNGGTPYLGGFREDPLCREGAGQVVRGGSYWSAAEAVRAAYRLCIPRESRDDNVGFRLAIGARVKGG